MTRREGGALTEAIDVDGLVASLGSLFVPKHPEGAPGADAARFLRKFNPNQLRDPDGKWTDIPGSGVGKDALKLAGRIHLDSGETLTSSALVSGSSGKARIAVTHRDGRRLLRVGVGSESFGTRDDEAGPWTAGPDLTGVVNKERATLRDEVERLEAEDESLAGQEAALPDSESAARDRISARRDEIGSRLAEIDDVGAVRPSGYTTRLDEAGVEKLRADLEAAVVKAKAVEDAANAKWDEVDRVQAEIDAINAVRDPLVGRHVDANGTLTKDPVPGAQPLTPEEDARLDELTAAWEAAHNRLERLTADAESATEAAYGQSLTTGSVPGEWGDVHYEVYVDDLELGARATVAVVPPGKTVDQVVNDDESAGTFDLPELRKLLREVGPPPSTNGQRAARLAGARALAESDVDEIVRRVVDELTERDKQPQTHTGAMIALVPTADDAQRLAADGGEPAEQLHLTLRYLGKGADVGDDARAELVDSVREHFSGAPPIAGDLFAVSLFNPTGKEPCVVGLVGGEDVWRAHLACEAAVDAVEVELPEPRKPFVAHITFDYDADPERVAAFVDRTGLVVFDRVRVAFAGDYVDIDLGGEPDADVRVRAVDPDFDMKHPRSPKDGKFVKHGAGAFGKAVNAVTDFFRERFGQTTVKTDRKGVHFVVDYQGTPIPITISTFDLLTLGIGLVAGGAGAAAKSAQLAGKVATAAKLVKAAKVAKTAGTVTGATGAVVGAVGAVGKKKAERSAGPEAADVIDEPAELESFPAGATHDVMLWSDHDVSFSDGETSGLTIGRAQIQGLTTALRHVPGGNSQLPAWLDVVVEPETVTFTNVLNGSSSIFRHADVDAIIEALGSTEAHAANHSQEVALGQRSVATRNTRKFNPNQLRDPDGKWTDSSGGGKWSKMFGKFGVKPSKASQPTLPPERSESVAEPLPQPRKRGNRRSASVRESLAAAKSASDLNIAATEAARAIASRDISFAMEGSDLQVAREYAEGVLRGLEQYPNAQLAAVRVGNAGEGQGHRTDIDIDGVFARTRQRPDGMSEIIFDRKWSADADSYRGELAARAVPRRMGRGSTTSGPMGVAIHEFGHVVDNSHGSGLSLVARRYADQFLALHGAPRYNGSDEDERFLSQARRQAAIMAEVSTYSAVSDRELAAEAFADAIENADDAAELSLVIVDAFEDKVRRVT